MDERTPPIAAKRDGLRGHHPADLTLDASTRSLSEILALAAAASRSNTRLRILGARTMRLEDLVRIAVTGGDCVSFNRDRDQHAGQDMPRRGWFKSEA